MRAPITAGITTAAAVAADHGMTVGLEYHTMTITDSATSTLRLLDEVAATNLFTYWQPNWWTASGADVDARLADLAAIDRSLSHLHVYSWGSSGERFALAEGVELWPAAFAAANETASDWPQPRYAFMEFVADDDPDQFYRDAAQRCAAGSPTDPNTRWRARSGPPNLLSTSPHSSGRGDAS